MHFYIFLIVCVKNNLFWRDISDSFYKQNQASHSMFHKRPSAERHPFSFFTADFFLKSFLQKISPVFEG